MTMLATEQQDLYQLDVGGGPDELHPTQIQLLKLTQTKTTSTGSAPLTVPLRLPVLKCAAVYREAAPTTGGVLQLEIEEIQLPDLSSTGLDPVRESVHRERPPG